MTLACRSPDSATPTAATSTMIDPTLADLRNVAVSRSGCLNSRHNDTPSTIAPPVRNADMIVCGNVTSVTLFVSTAQMSVSSTRFVVGLNR